MLPNALESNNIVTKMEILSFLPIYVQYHITAILARKQIEINEYFFHERAFVIG